MSVQAKGACSIAELDRGAPPLRLRRRKRQGGCDRQGRGDIPA